MKRASVSAVSLMTCISRYSISLQKIICLPTLPWPNLHSFLSCLLSPPPQTFSSEVSPQTPHRFLFAAWQLADHLAGYEQQDAHEFCISLLDGLHTACAASASAMMTSSTTASVSAAFMGVMSSPPPVLGTACPCIVHRAFSGMVRSMLKSTSHQFTRYRVCLCVMLKSSSHHSLVTRLTGVANSIVLMWEFYLSRCSCVRMSPA